MLNTADMSVPLLVYSFSSRGFPELSDLFNAAAQLVSRAYLVSLYDYKYYLADNQFLQSDTDHIRVWDSGGYEISLYGEYGDRFDRKGELVWNSNLYVETAQGIPWNGNDILVNYDESGQVESTSKQIDNALALFQQIPGHYVRDILIHFDGEPDPKRLAQAIKPFAEEFHVLGVTEKEIAPTWAHGAHFLKVLRNEMSQLGINDALRVHVFGCLDPKSIIRFTLAGADIFDGLSWIRHFFDRSSTLYRREFEFSVSTYDLVNSPSKLQTSLLAQNISQLEGLRADLTYSLAMNDFGRFESDQKAVDEAFHMIEQARERS